MSDWQVGDLALCVKLGEWPAPEEDALDGIGPQAGETFVVTYVFDPVEADLDGSAGLELDRYPEEIFAEHRFVKATPPAADEFDRETIALMNRVEQPA